MIIEESEISEIEKTLLDMGVTKEISQDDIKKAGKRFIL